MAPAQLGVAGSARRLLGATSRTPVKAQPLETSGREAQKDKPSRLTRRPCHQLPHSQSCRHLREGVVKRRWPVVGKSAPSWDHREQTQREPLAPGGCGPAICTAQGGICALLQRQQPLGPGVVASSTIRGATMPLDFLQCSAEQPRKPRARGATYRLGSTQASGGGEQRPKIAILRSNAFRRPA